MNDYDNNVENEDDIDVFERLSKEIIFNEIN